MPVSTSLSSPSFASARFKAVRLSGAKPRPNRCDGRGVDAAALEIFARLGAGDAIQLLGDTICDLGHDVGEGRGALGALLRLGSGAGTSIPALAASSLTASMNGIRAGR